MTFKFLVLSALAHGVWWSVALSVIHSHLRFMTPDQCRAARALLRWSQDDLATKATINPATLRNFESGRTTPQRASIAVLRHALEGEGVVFLEPAHGLGPGVALRASLPL